MHTKEEENINADRMFKDKTLNLNNDGKEKHDNVTVKCGSFRQI